MNRISVLAQDALKSGRLDAMQDYLHAKQYDPMLWWGLVALLAGAGLLVLILYYLYEFESFRRNRERRSASRLFRESLQALGLPLADRVVLHRLVGALALEHPTMILVSGATLRWAAQQWSELPPTKARPRTRDLDHVRDLADRVFGPAVADPSESTRQTPR